MGESRIIAILTDFGQKDTYVAEMKAVILSIAPDVKIVDLTHEIPQGDIHLGAFNLWRSYRYFPAKTVFLCVVDPGVGTQRKPIIVKTRKYYFVGPDNGLFGYVLSEEKEFEAFEITVRGKISYTFHGRDVFAPVSARLAKGIPPHKLGKPLKEIKLIEFPKPEIRENEIEGKIIAIDRFGNLITNISENLLNEDVEVEIKGVKIKGLKRCYEGDSPICIIDSCGMLEIALPNGDCSKFLNAKVGEKIKLRAIK